MQQRRRTRRNSVRADVGPRTLFALRLIPSFPLQRSTYEVDCNTNDEGTRVAVVGRVCKLACDIENATCHKYNNASPP